MRLRREGKFKPGVNLVERLGGKRGQNTRPFKVTQLTMRRVEGAWIKEGTQTTGTINLRREKVRIRKVKNVRE
jgi:hypothetical protein